MQSMQKQAANKEGNREGMQRLPRRATKASWLPNGRGRRTAVGKALWCCALGLKVRLELKRDVNNAELFHSLKVFLDSFFSRLLVLRLVLGLRGLGLLIVASIVRVCGGDTLLPQNRHCELTPVPLCF